MLRPTGSFGAARHSKVDRGGSSGSGRVHSVAQFGWWPQELAVPLLGDDSLRVRLSYYGVTIYPRFGDHRAMACIHRTMACTHRIVARTSLAAFERFRTLTEVHGPFPFGVVFSFNQNDASEFDALCSGRVPRLANS